MPADVPLRCLCGSLTGIATDVDPACGNRLVCMCDDCQAYAHWLGHADEMLDASGGTEVFQLTPAQVRFTAGQEHLRCMRLAPKGLLRWYAGCCRTPVANTLAWARLPFLGLPRPFLPADDEALGPILARVNGRWGTPPLPPGSHARGPLWLVLRVAGQMARGFVKGAHAPSPLFDAAGRPVVEPEILSADERERLRVPA